MPLTQHCKKCTVMWQIMALIGKNPLTSVTSLHNLEMSQCSSDVPMLVNFSIYISLISSLNWVVSFKIIILHWLQCFSYVRNFWKIAIVRIFSSGCICSTFVWTEKFNNGLCTHFSGLHGLKSSGNSSYLINCRCEWTLKYFLKSLCCLI